jgi:hypothetical protein
VVIQACLASIPSKDHRKKGRLTILAYANQTAHALHLRSAWMQPNTAMSRFSLPVPKRKCDQPNKIRIHNMFLLMQAEMDHWPHKIAKFHTSNKTSSKRTTYLYIARFATPPKHPKPQEIIKTDWKSERCLTLWFLLLVLTETANILF